MNRAEAERILVTLRGELVEAERAFAEAERRVSGLRKVIDGYVELFPDLASGPAQRAQDHQELRDHLPGVEVPDAHPKGRDAIRAILMENPDRSFTVEELTEQMLARGWLDRGHESPQNPVRAATVRLFKAEGSDRGNIRRDRNRDGIFAYRFRPQATSFSNGLAPTSQEVHTA